MAVIIQQLVSFCLSSCQCDGLKGELADLQQLYDSSQRERVTLEQELQRCKAELQKLVGKKSQVRTGKGQGFRCFDVSGRFQTYSLISVF